MLRLQRVGTGARIGIALVVEVLPQAADVASPVSKTFEITSKKSPAWSKNTSSSWGFSLERLNHTFEPHQAQWVSASILQSSGEFEQIPSRAAICPKLLTPQTLNSLDKPQLIKPLSRTQTPTFTSQTRKKVLSNKLLPTPPPNQTPPPPTSPKKKFYSDRFKVSTAQLERNRWYPGGIEPPPTWWSEQALRCRDTRLVPHTATSKKKKFKKKKKHSPPLTLPHSPLHSPSPLSTPHLSVTLRLTLLANSSANFRVTGLAGCAEEAA